MICSVSFRAKFERQDYEEAKVQTLDFLNALPPYANPKLLFVPSLVHHYCGASQVEDFVKEPDSQQQRERAASNNFAVSGSSKKCTPDPAGRLVVDFAVTSRKEW